MISGKTLKRYKTFHDLEPKDVQVKKIKTRMIPKELIALGDLREIVYLSDKWDNKKRAYVHKFKKPYPKLLTNQGGDQLYILGGKYKVKSEGIVG